MRWRWSDVDVAHRLHRRLPLPRSGERSSREFGDSEATTVWTIPERHDRVTQALEALVLPREVESEGFQRGVQMSQLAVDAGRR